MVKIESGQRCPICGEEVYRGNITWGHDLLERGELAATRYNVYCQHCQLEITLEGYDVIGKWNRHLKQEADDDKRQR